MRMITHRLQILDRYKYIIEKHVIRTRIKKRKKNEKSNIREVIPEF